MFKTDVVILGAGAAGLFCAGVAQQQGLKVLILDHYPLVIGSILFSSIIGIVSGIIPAIQGSRLSAVEALRR